MQKSNEVRLYNKCHKINLSSPFADFLFYISPTISYLWVWTIETSSLPNYSMRPLQIKIFSGIQTVYFNCKYFSLYTRELLGCLLLRGQLKLIRQEKDKEPDTAKVHHGFHVLNPGPMTQLFEGQFFSAIMGLSFNLSFCFGVLQNIIFFIHFRELVIISVIQSISFHI